MTDGSDSQARPFAIVIVGGLIVDLVRSGASHRSSAAGGRIAERTRVRIFRIGLILAGGTVLLLSLGSSWKDRQELQKVTAANDFLRKSLGEMTLALTSKDKEIDRLEQAGCAGREQTPPGTPQASTGNRKGMRVQ